MDWDRLPGLIERYVVVQEATLALNMERVACLNEQEQARRELDARAVAAQEKAAEGRLTVAGTHSGEIVQHHRVPVPDVTPATADPR